MKPPGHLCTLVLFSIAQVHALDVPAGGTDIRSGSLQAAAKPESGKVETLDQGRRITITKSDEYKPFIAQFTAPCAGDIMQGERVLAIIKARVVGETQTGIVTAKLQLNEAPYTAASAATDIAISRNWRELPVKFIANEGIPSGKAAVVLLCGHKDQSIEVESVQVLKYPASADFASFPSIQYTYEGRAADAPWRKAALERIEQQRKADLALKISGDDGKPLANTKVKLTLRKHEFGFGSAVPAKWIVNNSGDGLRFREIVDKLFSIVVFENDLKDDNWWPGASPKNAAARNAELDKAFAWFAGRHIAVRGHYLMQVATPFHLRKFQDDAVAIHDGILTSTRERLEFVKDRVCVWDVINHPIAWSGADMLNSRQGLEQIDREVFQLARTLTKLPFFVNEDHLFHDGRQNDGTFEYVKALNDAGLTVAGLGNQAHFHESALISPEQLLAITDRFAAIVPQQAITEFDIITDDEDLAADYTRDVLIATFSHPAYSSFLLWGFWEGSHWRPEAASWNKDWTPRKRGEVLEAWISRKWHTEVTLKTNAKGRVTWRGFPGWYDVKVSAQTKSFPVTKAQPQAEVKL